MTLPRAIHRTQAWYRRLTVPQFTVVTGLLVIMIGTLLLSSPVCSSRSVGLWEALFTATSAVTVTGLTVIDVGKDLTTVGQAVLANDGPGQAPPPVLVPWGAGGAELYGESRSRTWLSTQQARIITVSNLLLLLL